MNLNIGSTDPRGKYKAKNWINIDILKYTGVNVQGNALELPFADNVFSTIHCVHVLEHLIRDKPKRILGEAYRVLSPGGYLFVEVPNFKETVKKLYEAFRLQDERRIHIWTTSIYGKNERCGMGHFWGFSEFQLKQLMGEVGLKKLEWLVDKVDMISPHYRREPILLIKGLKKQ